MEPPLDPPLDLKINASLEPLGRSTCALRNQLKEDENSCSLISSESCSYYDRDHGVSPGSWLRCNPCKLIASG